MTLSSPINSLLANVVDLPFASWKISPNCDRFSAGKSIFYKQNNTFQAVSNNSTFSMDFVDNTLTYAISGSTVWKFDSSGKYILYANLSTLYTITDINSYQNRVIVTATNGSAYDIFTGAQIIAFVDENGGLTKFFNSTFEFSILYPIKIT